MNGKEARLNIIPFDETCAYHDLDEVKPWKVGETITRDNIASFIWQSFMLSRGSAPVQALTLKHLKQFGFLANDRALVLVIAELTDQEKALIHDRYKQARTSRHTDKEEENFFTVLEIMFEALGPMSRNTRWVNIVLSCVKKDTRKAVKNAIQIRKKLKATVSIK